MVRIKDILKLENIIKVDPKDTLSHALSKLSTSHDAGFVFENDKLIGLINPYYCLIRNSYPGNAKVEHCTFHPPRVKTNYSIDKLIHLMMESKVHYLPVFNEQDKFMGITSARHLLDAVKDRPVFRVSIGEILQKKKKPLLTVSEDDFISSAINLFKQHKVSKLIVVGKDGKLKGILSYYDLIHFLMIPKHKSHLGERDGNKVGFQHQLVRNFSKSYVITCTAKNSMADALKTVLEKKIGSIVITDESKHPLGIITTRDFLTLILRPEPALHFEIVNKNLSEQNRHVVGGFFDRIYLQLKKIPDLTRAKMLVKEEKNGGLFEVALSLIPKKGEPTVYKKEGRNLVDILKKIHKN